MKGTKYICLFPLISVGIMLLILFAAMEGQAAEVKYHPLDNDEQQTYPQGSSPIPILDEPDRDEPISNEIPPFPLEIDDETQTLPPGWQKALEQGADIDMIYPQSVSTPLDWGGPDDFGYTYLDSNEPDGPSAEFEDISTSGTAISFSDYYETVDLPFAFPFYGETYTQTNLYGDCYYCWSDFTHLGFGDPEEYMGERIYWMDYIDRDSGSIYVYSDTMSSPARFIIQYDDVYNYNLGSNTTSQVILYENGDILVRYFEGFDYWWYGSGMPELVHDYYYFAYAGYPEDGLAVQFYYPEGAWLWPPTISGAYPAGGTRSYNLWLHNDTGGINIFELSVSGNAWLSSVFPQATGELPNDSITPITVTVDIPPGASPGDQDELILEATSSGDVYSDTSRIKTTAVCTPALIFEGTGEAEDRLDDVYDYGGQGFTYINLHSYQQYGNGYNAYVSAYNPSNEEWVDLAYKLYWQDLSFNQVYVPPIYTKVRIEQNDYGNPGSIYYDYEFIVCRLPTVVLQPSTQEAFSQPDETAVYTLTLTNYMMEPDTFDLSVQDNDWSTTFWVGNTQIYDTGILDDLETFTFNVHIEVPSGNYAVRDQAQIKASSEGSAGISAEASLSTIVLPHRLAITYSQKWSADESTDPEEYLDILRQGTVNQVQMTDDVEWQEGNPAVAAYPREAIVAAWMGSYQSNELTGYSNIEYMALDSDGNTVIPITQVSDNSGAILYTSDEDASLAIAPNNGNVLFGWRRYIEDFMVYYESNIYYAVHTSDGSVLQSPIALTTNEGYPLWDSNPSAAAFGDGNFLLSWVHYDDSSYIYDVMVAVLDSSGALLAGPINLTDGITPTEYISSLSVNELADGNVLITWRESIDYPNQIFYAVVDSAGDVVHPITQLTYSDYGSSYPDAVSLRNGKTMIAWMQYHLYDDEWGSQVAFTLIDESYSVITPTQVLTNTQSMYAYNISLARDADDNAVLTWQDEDGNIYGAAVDHDGNMKLWPYLYLSNQHDLHYSWTNHSSGSLPEPILSINKTASPEPVEAGGLLTYTLVVANDGFEDATAVLVTDTLPADTTFVSADSGGALVNGVVTWSGMTVEVGEELTLSFVVRVSAELSEGDEILNSDYGVKCSEMPIITKGEEVVTTVIPGEKYHYLPLIFK